MSEETKLGHGVSGWKARQDSSRLRRSKDSEERAKIRDIRRQHKLGVSEPEFVEPESADLPEGVTGDGVEIYTPGGGWYRVYDNGVEVTDGSVRKKQAEAIAEERRNAAG